MKIVMFGTGDFALPTFLALLDSGHDVVGLVTQPDRPQGRKGLIVPSPIALAARSRGVPVLQPERVNEAPAIEEIRSLGAELFVTAAYGQILSAELLGVPRLGGINLHGSVLPKYRGAAPVARAIQNGEPESGVTVIRMTPRIDAGGMIAIARTPIGPDETADELEMRLAEIGAPLIIETLPKVESGTAKAIEQSGGKVTKAPKLSKSDSPIDWSKPARSVHDQVRALNAWPLAETFWHPSEISKLPVRLIVHKTEVVEGQGAPGTVIEASKDRLVVACGEGAIRLVLIQPVGKKPLPARDFLNGHRVFPGDPLGDEHPLTI